MRRALAVALLAASVPAVGAADFVCGQTGFNSNVGAGKVFQCAPRIVQRGTGVLTFAAADETVTATFAGFADMQDPEAVPGGDGVFFRATGLMARVNGQTYFFNVIDKTSDSSIEVQLAGAAPAFSGTASAWAFWNTSCLRSGVATDPLRHTDARIWASIAPLSAMDQVFLESRATIYSYTHAAGGNGATYSILVRPIGLSTNTLTYLSSNTAGAGPSPIGTAALEMKSAQLTVSTGLKDKEFSFSSGSSTANTWVTNCVYAWNQPK